MITYIIIKDVSVSIPGDERSHTNPGHGYPASIETYQEVTEYANEDEWKDRIQKLMVNRVKFKCGRFEQVTPRLNVEY